MVLTVQAIDKMAVFVYTVLFVIPACAGPIPERGLKAVLVLQRPRTLDGGSRGEL